MIKKIFTAAVGMGLVMAAVMPAFAANQCGNQTTGPSSINICNRLLTKTHALSLSNSGTVTHNVTGTSISGSNTASGNTNGGTVSAGAAGLLTSKMASLNTGNMIVGQTDPASDDVGLNDTTGPSSSNNVTFNTIKTISLGLTNSGSVSQTVTGTATSGNNQSNGNTIGGSVTTGASTVDTTISTMMNDLILVVNQ